MTDRQTHKTRYKQTKESEPNCRECGSELPEHHHTAGTGNGDVTDIIPLCRQCHQDDKHHNPEAVSFQHKPRKMGGNFKQ